MDWEREELARTILENADIGTPIDPYLLAKRLSFRVEDGGEECDGVCLDELRLILVDESQRRERRGFAVAHELGHFHQREEGWEQPGRATRRDEAGANYLASALILPRFEFDLSLKRLGWDLLALKAEHRFASFEALARRICALRDARAFVFDRPLDGQAEPAWPRYSVPWGLHPSDNERIAALEAANGGAPVEPVAGITAWPVIESRWVRVITVASTA